MRTGAWEMTPLNGRKRVKPVGGWGILLARNFCYWCVCVYARMRQEKSKQMPDTDVVVICGTSVSGEMRRVLCG